MTQLVHHAANLGSLESSSLKWPSDTVSVHFLSSVCQDLLLKLSLKDECGLAKVVAVLAKVTVG